MLTERQNRIWDAIVENGIATNEEIGLVVGAFGMSEENLNKIIYVRTGYNDIEQFLEEEED